MMFFWVLSEQDPSLAHLSPHQSEASLPHCESKEQLYSRSNCLTGADYLGNYEIRCNPNGCDIILYLPSLSLFSLLYLQHEQENILPQLMKEYGPAK